MSRQTVGLAVVGCTLIAASMGSCYVIVVAEQAPPLLLAAFFGGLMGGGPLTLATFRLWNRGAPDAWPSIAQATTLLIVGTVVSLLALGSSYFLGASRLGSLPLATFFVGFAFTIGAAMLLAWAAAGQDSTR